MLSTPHHHRAPQLAIWLMADSMEIFEYTDILFMANLDQGPKLLKAEGCAKACSARPNCAGFSLTMDENCWLKKGGGRPRLARNFAVTSALKRRNGIMQSFDAPAVDVCGAPLAEKLLPTFTKEGAPLNQDDPNQSSNGDKKNEENGDWNHDSVSKIRQFHATGPANTGRILGACNRDGAPEFVD